MTDFYSQNRCVCSTRSHGPLLCAFCLSFHFNIVCRTNKTELIAFQMMTFFGHLAQSLRPVTAAVGKPSVADMIA